MSDWHSSTTTRTFVRLPSGAWVVREEVVAVVPGSAGFARVLLSTGSEVATRAEADDLVALLAKDHPPTDKGPR